VCVCERVCVYVCAAAAAPVLMQPRTNQLPVILLSQSVLTGEALQRI